MKQRRSAENVSSFLLFEFALYLTLNVFAFKVVFWQIFFFFFLSLSLSLYSWCVSLFQKICFFFLSVVSALCRLVSFSFNLRCTLHFNSTLAAKFLFQNCRSCVRQWFCSFNRVTVCVISLILLAVNSDWIVQFVNKTLLHAVQTTFTIGYLQIFYYFFRMQFAVCVPWLKNVIEI